MPLDIIRPEPYSASLKSKGDLSKDVMFFEFELINKPMPFKAGQFVSVVIEKPDGQVAKRPYSIVNSPQKNNSDTFIELCIKILEGGEVSGSIKDIAIGTEVRLDGPFGRFALVEDDPNDIVFVATGTGIAPYIGMLEELEGSSKNISLIAGYRYEDDILYKERIDNMMKELSGNHLISISKPSKNWDGHTGYVTKLLKEVIKDPSKTTVYLCGNPGMVDDAKAELQQIGVPTDHVVFEKFTSLGKAKAKKAQT